MDYGRILTRAWEITWRYKILWVLGFLAALGNGGGGGSGGNARFSGDQARNFHISPQISALLVGLLCVLFVVAIVLWVLSIMARGGLIAGVAQVEDKGTTTLSQAFEVGRRRFWTLFGIGILEALPIIVLVGLAVVGFLATGAGAAIMAGDSIDRAIGPILTGLLLCALPLICLIVILAIVLNQIRLYAERAAILEGLGWIEAFGRGWRVLRANLGPTLIFWLIFLVIGLIIGAIVLAGVLAIAAPFIAVLSVGGQQNFPNWLLVPICTGGLIGAIIAAVIGSVVETFTSSTWTLVYRQLTRPTSPPVVTPSVEPVA